MQNGTYFITICAKQRHHLFGEVQDGKMMLPESGACARQCIEKIETIYPSVLLDAFVVMPNHVHLLLVFLDYNNNPSPQRIVGQYKSAVTKQIGFSLWQDDAYVSAILTARKNKVIRRYIRENPSRWETDKFNAAEGE
jgi:REP element-mobilizing transposase RayT